MQPFPWVAGSSVNEDMNEQRHGREEQYNKCGHLSRPLTSYVRGSGRFPLKNASTLSEVTRRSSLDRTVETGSPRQFG